MSTPKRIDFLFTVGDLVVGVESKTMDDCISSWMSGRLQRQFRNMFQLCDRQVLWLRRLGTSWGRFENFHKFGLDLAKFQMLGGIVLPVEEADPVKLLASTKAVLAGERNPLTAVSWHEKPRTQGNTKEAALQRLLTGVGPKTSKRLLAKFGSVVGVLSATAEELQGARATKRVVRAGEELR